MANDKRWADGMTLAMDAIADDTGMQQKILDHNPQFADWDAVIADAERQKAESRINYNDPATKALWEIKNNLNLTKTEMITRINSLPD